MDRYRRSSCSYIFTGILLATLILPEFLLAVPVNKNSKEDGMEKGDSVASSKRLIRNRRNISWYKQHSDFWNWYKFFTDTGNQDGVGQLDRVFLAYLQNKNRAEAQRSHKAYLQHLSEIYKSCAESDDPNCVASYTSRQKATEEPPKPVPIRSCDPYRDPYCRYPRGYTLYPYAASAPAKAPTPAPGPAPVKSPAYIRAPAPKNLGSSNYYYAPMVQSFLSAEQKAELLHICGAEDVECLQYHLRGAYGYKPASVASPSYSHLGCDPKNDPYCVQQNAQKNPVGMYLRYPSCDPQVDPYCAYAASQRAEAPSPPASPKNICNPLFDANCNPLTAARFASLAASSKDRKDEPAYTSHHYDPYAMYQDAAASSALSRTLPAPHQMPQHLQPPSAEENVHPLGPPGKTKEGYDCFIGYDEECYLVGSQPMRSAVQNRQVPEAYEPHLNEDGSRKGVIEPDPDCDPEYDRNCRLRRYDSESPEMSTSDIEQHPVKADSAPYEETPQLREEAYPEQWAENQGYDQQQYDRYMSGQEDPYATYGPPEPNGNNFQEIRRAYAGHFPDQVDQHAYKKK